MGPIIATSFVAVTFVRLPLSSSSTLGHPCQSDLEQEQLLPVLRPWVAALLADPLVDRQLQLLDQQVVNHLQPTLTIVVDQPVTLSCHS